MTVDRKPLRWPGALPLAGLAWHGVFTATNLGPQYLLYACYPANLLLAIGVLAGLRMCAGVGAFIAVVAFPLYLFHAMTTLDPVLSGAVFHASGAIVGLWYVIACKQAKYTWIGASLLTLVLHGTARVFTDPEANVNVAFRTFSGDLEAFPSFPAYLAAVYAFFGLSFLGMQVGSNLYHGRRGRNANA